MLRTWWNCYRFLRRSTGRIDAALTALDLVIKMKG
jgi:hypothetical protein